MEGGTIVEEGHPSTFFSAPHHPATRTFLRLVEHQAPTNAGALRP